MHSNDSRMMPDPLGRAMGVLASRGQSLPQSALRHLAREVLIRMRTAQVGRPDGVLQGFDAMAFGEAGWSVDEAVSALCDALMGPRDTEAAELVEDMRRGCSDPDVLYQHCIAGAVRQLGDRWEAGEASVSQVIIGSGRVYAILRTLRDVYATHRLKWSGEAVAAFVSVPGEQHSLGVVMAAEHFRRRGWAIDQMIGFDHDELVQRIQTRRPPIVAIGASSREMAFAMARLIVAVRVTHPGVWIMVAGQICQSEPALQDLVDADALITDLDTAERLMTAVMSAAQSR